MVNNVYTSIKKYFDSLAKLGYENKENVNKLLLYSFIQELLDNDFRGMITEEDYNIINRVLYCLYGTTCLIPFPEYHNNKNTRIMYTGSMSELAQRVEKVEAYIGAFDDDKKEFEKSVDNVNKRIDVLEDTEVLFVSDN